MDVLFGSMVTGCKEKETIFRTEEHCSRIILRWRFLMGTVAQAQLTVWKDNLFIVSAVSDDKTSIVWVYIRVEYFYGIIVPST